ncbi:hypothetical protein HPB49_025420 [Dermacentor silvarum]|uniref:Uncharacterized protein n=1 Tax=Dermacentor silvarum TaxID=543639 RepID=A0ACB8DRE8_DERSI|nr:hypothetical protein HPB49_025420 [Dermacentor silvarum]
MKECLFLHCDVTGRPYRLEDFRDPLQELGVLKDVTGIGPFQMTHVWLIKLRTPEAKEVLVNAGGLEVKGCFCAVIDPVQQDITLKVHWVPFHITGEALKRTFDHYGEVKECSSSFPAELQFAFVVDAKDTLGETAECQDVLSAGNSAMKHKTVCVHMQELLAASNLKTRAEQVASDAEKVATPSASTQDDTAGRKQRQRKMQEEVRTPPAPEDADHGRDELNVEMVAEPDTPYETPDETATATPSKRHRRDAPDEETQGEGVQRLEPQWMEVRSTRAKKGKYAPAQRSASLTREGEATQCRRKAAESSSQVVPDEVGSSTGGSESDENTLGHLSEESALASVTLAASPLNLSNSHEDGLRERSLNSGACLDSEDGDVASTEPCDCSYRDSSSTADEESDQGPEESQQEENELVSI